MTSFYAQLPRRPQRKLPRSATPALDADPEARFSAPPLDLSFKHIGTLAAAAPSRWAGEPRNPRGPSPRRTGEGKYACASLKLNNNLIRDWAGLEGFVASLIGDAGDLTWLDLSFNYLVGLDDVVLRFPNLKILYLHGNGVEDLKEVDKLAGLPKLMSLTLHGNPVDGERGYRHYVLNKLPQLRALDFSRVTKAERETAQIMVNFLGYSKKKDKKRRRTKTL